jgi:hypothetical protein
VWTVGTLTEFDANATVPNEPFFFKDYLAENWVVDPVHVRSIGVLSTSNSNNSSLWFLK